MLDIRVSSASQAIAAVISNARNIPATVIPYAAAAAITRVANIAAKTDLPAAMATSFDRPTRWTLNSLRIEPANKNKLSARIHVKNQPGSGTPQENYLLPGVEGGPRREKGLEKSLRYSGILPPGQRLMPGSQIQLDAFGNIPQPLVKKISLWAKTGAPAKKAANRKAKTKATNPLGYFLFGKPSGISGIAQRSGPIVMPLVIFTKTQPTYRPRLDFTGIAEKTALTHFGPEFARAAADILSRPR